MSIGQTIKEYRKNRNLSQSEMGKKLGVSHMAVSYWETGQNYPSLQNTGAIAEEILSNGDVERVRAMLWAFLSMDSSQLEMAEEIISVLLSRGEI